MESNGRIEEFVGLLANHESRLRAFVVSLIANWADSDEVLQQAYLVMWKKFGEFQHGSNFFAWAGRIVFLESQAFRKRKAHEKLRFSDDFLNTVTRETEKMAEELDERQQILNQCMAKLKPSHRELLRLRYVEGSKIEALGTAFNRSGTAIYQALCRIRRVLLDCVNRALAEATA